MTPSADGGKIRVLVVEDEPILLLHASDIVEEAGYEPVLARNADEAIAILERNSDIRIVFTDIQMPGSMDGLKLAAFVRWRWPPIEIIVASGQMEVTAADLPARGRFFRKPYNSQHIIDALQGMAA
jgi:CheY-like chemotaxis protein